jgi:transposase
LHSDEFKANAVASSMQHGMSMAAVAMANGINANLLRRWVREAETRRGAGLANTPLAPKPRASAVPAAFVPMELPAKSATADIRIELRRGGTLVAVTWPIDAAAECAAWLRELLR